MKKKQIRMGDNMYAVDEIIGNYAKLEDLMTKEIINVDINNLPKLIKEKDIVKKEKDIFLIDEECKKERLRIIQEKFKRLKNN